MKASVQSIILIMLLVVSVLTSMFLLPDGEVRSISTENQKETIIAASHLHTELEYVAETDGNATVSRLGQFITQKDLSMKGYHQSWKPLLFVTILSTIFMSFKKNIWKGAYCAMGSHTTYERVIQYILNQDGKK